MSKTQKHAFTPSLPEGDRDSNVLGRQVLGALLRPAATIAKGLGLPLKTVGEAAELAYFRSVRQGHKTQAEVSQALDVSVRTVANLSRQMKRELLSRDAVVSLELTRKVEFLLWSEPLSELRIAQALPDVGPGDVTRALRTLIDEGRIKRGGGRTPVYEAIRSATRLVDRKGWLSRLDGLHSLLETVANTVAARFLQPDDGAAPNSDLQSPDSSDAPALARNLQLRVRPQDLPKLRELYENQIFPTLVALDAEANDDPEAQPMAVAYLYCPQNTSITDSDA